MNIVSVCEFLESIQDKQTALSFIDWLTSEIEDERTLQWLAGKKHRRMEGEWFIIYGSWKKFIAQAMKIYDGNQRNK